MSSNPAKIRERYWQKYESVAHLWAGSIQAEAEVPIEQKTHWLRSPQECLTMLATSEKLLEMLAGHHPRNRNSPAVDALRAWRAPSRNLLPLPEVVVGPIMEEWKRLISEYNPET